MLIVCELIAGCSSQHRVESVDAGKLTMKSLIMQPNEQWRDKFGDELDVSQTYTLRLLVEMTKQQQAQLNVLKKDTRLIQKRVSKLEEGSPIDHVSVPAIDEVKDTGK